MSPIDHCNTKNERHSHLKVIIILRFNLLSTNNVIPKSFSSFSALIDQIDKIKQLDKIVLNYICNLS